MRKFYPGISISPFKRKGELKHLDFGELFEQLHRDKSYFMIQLIVLITCKITVYSRILYKPN